MTPRLYTMLAVRLHGSRGALYVAVIVLIALALYDRDGARYFTSVAMLAWGMAVATYLFRPPARKASRDGREGLRFSPWLLAVGLNVWLLLAIHLLFV